MFQKKTKHIKLNRCKSFTLNKKKKFNYLNNNNAHQSDIMNDLKFTSMEDTQTPIGNINKKNKQIKTLTKTIKISFNKYHQYIKNVNDLNNNYTKRPFSLYNKNRNNNRGEIGNNYISSTRNKNYLDNFKSNSFKELSHNNNNIRQKINLLNMSIYSPNNENNSFKSTKFNSFNNHTINKKMDNLKLNQGLKYSKFFNKTKYINGIKNKKIKKKNGISLSTYNILLEQNHEESKYDSINEMLIKQLDSYLKNESNTKNQISNDTEQYEGEKAKYYDLLPIVLNNIRQKRITDDIYQEYKKYLSKITENTTSNNITNKNNRIRHPIIKYLFLQNIINNLQHIVKFIDIQNKEELERKVIKILGEEYSKLEESKSINKDFFSYGYEYNPNIIYNNYKYLMNKGQQTSKISYKKSIFFINEKKLQEINNFTNNNNVISPTRKFVLNKNKTERKKLIFDIKQNECNNKNEEEEKLKDNIKDILSDHPLKKEKGRKNKRNEKTVIIKNNEFFKSNELKKNVRHFLEKSTSTRNEKEKKKIAKPKFIKIRLNKLKINEDMKQKNNNNKRLDSTDKMNNIPPSLERLNQENEQEEISRKESINNKKDNNNKSNNRNKRFSIASLKNDFLVEKTNKDKYILSKNNELSDIKNRYKNNNKENKDNSIENENNNDQVELTKDNKKNENPPKSGKFKRKRKKTIKISKEKRKSEKEKKIMDNQDILLREIRKMEELKKKKRKTGFNILFQNNDNLLLSKFKDSKNSEDYYSSLSSSNENILNLSNSKEIKKDENDNENITNEEEENSILSSVSEITNDLEELKEIKNIMKPKTKKEAFDEEQRINFYKRRGAVVMQSPDVFKNAIKSKELSDLNVKMKQLYDTIYRQKKREEIINRRRKRKHYRFTFIGVDLSNIKDIEDRKKVHLASIKEDIKNKIKKGKIHYNEYENFLLFEKLMNDINLEKLKGDKKRIADYVRSLEKYFHLFYYEILNNEIKKKDEDRINKFLYQLHEEIGETIPYVIKQKGKRCRSTDYNKEINLSEINDSNKKS